MRYKAKSMAALQLALGGLPDRMRVEVESGIEVRAKTIGELRKVTIWPEDLAITTPQERQPESAVRVSKANVATRTSPKS
jgi:translation initiation factor IF-1